MSAIKSFCLHGSMCLRTVRKRLIHSCRKDGIEARNVFSPRFDFKSQVEKDVLLFTSNKGKVFIFMNSLSFCQCIFWSYMGHFVYFTMRNHELNSNSAFWNWLYNKEKNYSTILAALAILFGSTIFVLTSLYTTRSVKLLTLHKGGKHLTIVTYKFPGIKNVIKVPISEVSAASSRTKAKHHLALKVKNKYFYYLIDMKGEFKNPSLFDFTAGIQRNF